MARERARIHLEILGQSRVAESDIAVGPARLEGLVPLAEAVVSVATDIAVEDAEARGRTIRCSKGCGACCRQMVPIAAVEAVRIARLVAEMEEPRRTEVRQRFARAVVAFKALGIFEWDETYRTYVLAGDASSGKSAFESGAHAYFHEGIACPFLEDEACSIHPQRPLVCREFLVTSDPELCRTLSPGIESLGRFADVTAALAELGAELAPDEAPPRAIPLTLSLEWAEAHGACFDREVDGETLFERFAARLAALDE